ncbi:MAG: hypothetical protein KAI28_00440 [Sphingomonadales bacterium]|nr:hypothetical protein [Sphingomonadales bacterium]
MDVFEFVIIIVVIGTVAQIFREHFKRKNSDIGSEKHKLNTRIEELEHRIATLERIATDGKSRLADEIDNL